MQMIRNHHGAKAKNLHDLYKYIFFLKDLGFMQNNRFELLHLLCICLQLCVCPKFCHPRKHTQEKTIHIQIKIIIKNQGLQNNHRKSKQIGNNH
jgi:hypothetical protein